MSGAGGGTKPTVDASLAQECIRAQFPEVECRTVGPLPQGGEFHAFEIDGRWVFRFPRGDQDEVSLLKEFVLLDAIADEVPLPVPRYRFRGEPSETFPYRFGGYARLPGTPAIFLDIPAEKLAGVAAEVGSFVDCIHGFDAQLMLSLGVPPRERDETMEAERRRSLADLERLHGVLPSHLLECCRAALEDASRIPKRHAMKPRLLHDDYNADHILLDPQTFRVTGVIDWGDACVGDPAEDFGRLYVWQGPEFVEAVMREYRHPLDDAIRDRTRFWGLRMAIGDTFWGHHDGQAEYVEMGTRCLRRMFGDE